MNILAILFHFFFFFVWAMWHVSSQFPSQGLNLHPLHSKLRILTTRLLGKSLFHFCFFNMRNSDMLWKMVKISFLKVKMHTNRAIILKHLLILHKRFVYFDFFPVLNERKMFFWWTLQFWSKYSPLSKLPRLNGNSQTMGNCQQGVRCIRNNNVGTFQDWGERFESLIC